MNSKWMIFVGLALVILLVLYVASLSVGLEGGRGRDREAPSRDRQLSVSLDAPWVQGLRQRMTAKLKSEELRLGFFSSGCRLDGDHVQVAVGGTCRFEIPPADKTRALHLQLVEGQSAAFTLSQEGALTIEDEPLVAGAEAGIYDIYRGETVSRLTINQCVTGEESEIDLCRVSLQ